MLYAIAMRQRKTNDAVLNKTTPILSVPSVVFTGSLLVALKRADLLVMRGGCIVTVMLEMTITGSHIHVGSQVLGKLCNRLLDVFLQQLFPDALYSNFQLINHHLRLLPQFILLFQHDAPDAIIQQV